ncbi:MAG: hypothetical protein OEV40_22760, partial [Acidimicrobiia bacterium]|nr:hypothetical protein [Acidimicrobiia bacterium]
CGRRPFVRADYEIYVKGHFGPELGHAFSDLSPDRVGASTRLRAAAIDQPTLHGILGRLHNFGIEIDAIWRTDA